MGEECKCGEDTCENSAGGNPNRTEALLFRVLRSEIGKMKNGARAQEALRSLAVWTSRGEVLAGDLMKTMS